MRSVTARSSLGTKATTAGVARIWAGTRLTSAEVSTILARGQVAASDAGHRKPVQAGKVNVQQYPVRASAGRGGQRLLPVRGRLQQVEAALGQQRSRGGAEARAVVDN